MDKKKEIIKAFENLDADMLDILLNDNQSYMDVTKEMFVEELRQYFKRNKSDYKSENYFKAYPGQCTKCNKGKTGYSFINSQNECYMSFLFEENEEDFTDIYKCSSFDTYEKEIENEWGGIFFYDDDNVSYLPTEKNIPEENGRLLKR